jgi:YjbE family integral membrane protein
MHFLLSALSIVLIDLLLAGDNALVIAMAVRSLPPRERRIGIIGGSAAAVVLRIGLTVVAARLLEIDYVKLVGGLFILWIAYRVLADASAEPDKALAPHRFWQAIWYIMVADITMSTDNILAIAAASHGNFWLITFGLALSIPFVVMSSNLLSKLMDRYPATIYLGAGLLGKVAGEMIMTDGFIKRTLAPSNVVLYGVQTVLFIFFAVLGWWMCSRCKPPKTAP